MLHLLFPGIHAHFRNSLQAYTKKSLTLAQEDFLLSLECFSVALVFYLLAELVGVIEEQQGILKHFPTLIHTMEQPSFSMGALPRETKQQKKERLRKEKAWKEKEARRKRARETSFQPVATRPPWLLLPSHQCKGFEFWILTLKGDTFLSKRNALLESIMKAQIPVTPVAGFDPSFGEQMKKEYLEKAQIVMSLLHQNQILRWKFKNFFTKVRIQRFQKLNEVDPITLESFHQPVHSHSFLQQKTYSYEAESFAKHIHKKLTHNDGHIALPLAAKNPFTNETFPLAQLMGLIHQCRSFGHTSWAIEAFVSARYDLTTFMAIHSKPLRLNALRMTMANMKDWDAIDTLYDFIKSEHLYHKKTFCTTLYKWALNHVPNEKRLESWRKMCIKYYETDILIDDPDMKESLFSVISGKTLPLCGVPMELQTLRKLSMKSQPPSEDGSSSARDSESEG